MIKNQKMSAEDKPADPGKNRGNMQLWISLAKWFLGSFTVVIVTMIIDYGFRDRAAGLQEIQQYDKYATELIILNENPKNRRMLAQFFSCVLPSARLREGWQAYYHVADSEYRAFLRQDSVISESIRSLTRLKENNRMTASDSSLLFQLRKELDERQLLLNQPIVKP